VPLEQELQNEKLEIEWSNLKGLSLIYGYTFMRGFIVGGRVG
jgi:hypothetical protein